MDRKYAIDSNILIICHRLIYPFDFAPSFWKQLLEKGGQSIVLLDVVAKEILKNEDQLSEWLENNKGRFTAKEVQDISVFQCYSKIITSVKRNTQYRETAKSEFASIADSWLCAYGLAYGDVIVTNERYEPNIKKRVKIPNVCHEFGIGYIGLLEFMREIGIRFD